MSPTSVVVQEKSGHVTQALQYGAGFPALQYRLGGRGG